jgi:kanamycin kinase
MLGKAPDRKVEVPRSVQELAAGAELVAVWVNLAGGITFRIDRPPIHRFVKWTPLSSGIDLSQEKARLLWAGRFISVPRVLEDGSDEEGSWLVTSPIDGETAVANRWRADPAKAVAAIGRGLRLMHERLPTRACPFSWTAEERVANALQRAERGKIDPQTWHLEHQHLSVRAAIDLVSQPPEVDRLVVCHGDACAPNTLLDASGAVVGHVDLGSLGLADRWADLAVASWSTCWNYGACWEGELLAAYGVDPDPARIGYYRLLWDLGP